MTYRFEFADKGHLCEILPVCFKILYSNMNVIAPTGNTYDEDFSEWYSNVFPAMQKDPRQIILMFDGDDIIGYFQYYVFDGSLMMEEIQIKSEYHGTGIFNIFYNCLVSQLPKDIKYVEAYSHKSNVKSQKILEHLGLIRLGENKNGNSFHYKGDYSLLLDKYLK